jgi:CRP-like cAMP-binding protein
MLTAQPPPVSNLLLDGLPRKERNRILQDCEPVELVFGKILCEADQPYRYLYFPLTGFISLVTALGKHPPLELGLIGNEGMLGATLALGVNAAPCRAVAQGPGSAWRISATQLRQLLQECPRLLRTLKRYLYVLLTQLSQNAACGHFHEVEPRLARWLLMTHDRAHADNFHLTHEYLAEMLGVRRSGVTIAAGALQLRQLIHYSRGLITILDRPGLEAAACECYNALGADYARLFNAPAAAPA